MLQTKINVLVVDDSRVARVLLVHLLESDPGIHVIGTVNDGLSAVEFVNEQRPDAVLMDIHMPGLDGFEATRRIMETNPVPIIICSNSVGERDVSTTFRLLEAGAVAFVEKPVAPDHCEYASRVKEMLRTVKLMSEVKVVRRWPRNRNPSPNTDSQAGLSAVAPWRASLTASPDAGPAAPPIEVILIGTSTGGPQALQTILAGLPKDLPVPILIVQHIAAGFLGGLADWLRQSTGFPVQIAANQTVPQAGVAYLAPDGFHMTLAANNRIRLLDEPPENGLRPAVSACFRSLAEHRAASTIGVLLTGMGKDGAAELKLLRDRGAVTIAQDRDSSVVHGMAGEAIILGGATHIMPINRIADALQTIVKRRQTAGR